LDWFKKCPHPISFNQDLESHQQFKIAIQHLFEDIKKKDTKDCKFDKDNPIHIEVITAMATIKCENFNIEFVNKDFFRIQRIAGHITPSLIVTSAISASLMCLNLYSIALEKNGIKTTYKNYNGDLSCSFILDKNLVMVNKKEIPKLELSHNIKLDDVVNELTHQKKFLTMLLF